MKFAYSFRDDYSEGCHPRILEALSHTNLEQAAGYSEDTYSLEAARLIQKQLEHPSAVVHLVSGGTQANLIILAALLKPYQSVIAATSAHINMHEAGAIEATGHKINTVKTGDGKLTPAFIQAIVEEHADEHMVKPAVVFISQATEVGTLYTKAELEALAECCRKYSLYLYVDGARLGSALAATTSDVSLADIARLVDIFYIGGTKNGALLGEAIVICNPDLQEHFRYYVKQRGGLLAKGRVLGVQFMELFKDDLYLELARHANAMAAQLTAGVVALGYSFLTQSATNQIFPILPNTVIEKLKDQYAFYVWAKVDDQQSAIRLVTSWATKEEAIHEFLRELKKLAA